MRYKYEVHYLSAGGMHVGTPSPIGITVMDAKTKKRVTVWGRVRSQHELRVTADLLLAEKLRL